MTLDLCLICGKTLDQSKVLDEGEDQEPRAAALADHVLTEHLDVAMELFAMGFTKEACVSMEVGDFITVAQGQGLLALRLLEERAVSFGAWDLSLVHDNRGPLVAVTHKVHGFTWAFACHGDAPTMYAPPMVTDHVDTYMVLQWFQDPERPAEVVKSGLTLDQAKAMVTGPGSEGPGWAYIWTTEGPGTPQDERTPRSGDKDPDPDPEASGSERKVE